MGHFDLNETRELSNLFLTPTDDRDLDWRKRFYKAVPEASLVSFDPQVELGPDTFPYFQLAVPDTGPLTPFCVASVLDFTIENGVGIAIFGDAARSAYPEWVFTYGNLLCFKLYGSFERDLPVSPSGGPPAEVSQVLVAAPSEAILPAAARRVLGGFMREKYQHPSPKVAFIGGAANMPGETLMFNLSLADYDGDEGKLKSAMHYLHWFLPESYGAMPLPPGWNDSSFVALE